MCTASLASSLSPVPLGNQRLSPRNGHCGWDPLTLPWLGTRLTPCGSGWTEWSCHCIWPLVSPQKWQFHMVPLTACFPWPGTLLPAACMKRVLLPSSSLCLSLPLTAFLSVSSSPCLSPPPLSTTSVFPGFPCSPPLPLSLPFFGGCTKGRGKGQAGASRAGSAQLPPLPAPPGSTKEPLHCVSQAPIVSL